MKIGNYRRIEIPEHKDKEDYTAAERRAYLYQEAMENGGTRSLPKTYKEYGEMFDVVQSMICRDVDAVRQSILEHELSQDKVREDIASTLLWINKKAKEEEDLSLLRKTQKTYKKWAQELGIEEKEPEKHEVEHKGLGEADALREIYEEEKDDGDDDGE